MKSIYLDHCATTPLSNEVQDILTDSAILDCFGNPSAVHHHYGKAAFDLVETARREIAAELSTAQDHVVFTGSSSEANNLVITGFWLRFVDRGCRIIYSSIEHKSALETAKRIGTLPGGISVEIGVDPNGMISLDELASLLATNPERLPTLVVVMQCNNEIPVRQPIEDIAELCLQYRAYFHCDAVQGFAREALKLDSGHFGSVTIAPHKIYGPKGIGILALSPGRLTPPLSPLLLGGEQEFGRRPGTLNTTYIAAAARSIQQLSSKREALRRHLIECDRVFIETMASRVKGFHLTVAQTLAAPGIVNFYIENHDAPSLLLKLPSVCMNRGASCTGAGGEKFSHVPKALGLPVEIQANVLRASFGWASSLDDIVEAVERISATVS